MIAQITNHTQAGLSRLLEQSRNKPNMTAVVSCMTNVVQQFENIAYPLLDGRFLATAVGAQLDGIGQLVGQPRNGQNDAVYKLFLLGRIYANSSTSSVPTVLALVQSLFGASSAQIIQCFSPGFSHRKAPAYIGIEIGSPTLDASLWQQAISLCQECLAASVVIAWVSVYDAAASFALDGPVAGPGLDGQAITDGMATLIFSQQGA